MVWTQRKVLSSEGDRCVAPNVDGNVEKEQTREEGKNSF